MLKINFTLKPITYKDAKEISKWKYELPYSIYNIDERPETFEELMSEFYYAAHIDHANILAGFFCFGSAAQIPVGHVFDVYSLPALDIGLGLKPELTGHGIGLPFLQKGIHFASDNFKPDIFRLTVATFNERAIKVYSRAGFTKQSLFSRTNKLGSMEFMVMTKINNSPSH